MYVYEAKLDRLIGPVSLSVELDLGFRIRLTVPVRLDGVTLPEREDRERARLFTSDWLAARDSGFVVHSVQGRRQTFERWFAVVADHRGEQLNAALLAAGLVAPYESGVAPEDSPAV